MHSKTHEQRKAELKEKRSSYAVQKAQAFSEMAKCKCSCPNATNSDLMVMCANRLNWNIFDNDVKSMMRFAVTRVRIA